MGFELFRRLAEILVKADKCISKAVRIEVGESGALERVAKDPSAGH